jgi:hypothetical protein
MLSFQELFARLTRRWRAVTSTPESSHPHSLHELLGSLEGYRKRISAQSPLGGRDTPRALLAWRGRVSPLDGYLASAGGSVDGTQDLDGVRALSAAEYEGWPLGTPQQSHIEHVVLAEGADSMGIQRR